MADSIAVLGTGIMGAPIARNLARAGFEVRAWNRTRAKAQSLAGDGVRVADSPADAATGAGFVLTMLGDGNAVESTMTTESGALPAMGDNAIWLQCATVGIDATDQLAEIAASAGIAFVDAPVLGTKKPAEDAKLTVLASGPAELEQTLPPCLRRHRAKGIGEGLAVCHRFHWARAVCHRFHWARAVCHRFHWARAVCHRFHWALSEPQSV
jgi:3-hydroxyisobutyrate dehydrogenase